MSEPEKPVIIPKKGKIGMFELAQQWEFIANKELSNYKMKGAETGRFDASVLNRSSATPIVAIDYHKAEVALLAFAAKFPEATKWMEQMRSVTETSRRGGKSNLMTLDEDPACASRAELDKRFIEFRRQIKRNMRLFGLLPKKKKPTANVFVRLWRKLRRWKRPEKPGRQLLGPDELYRWASRIAQKFEETSSLIWTFGGAPVSLMAVNDPETGRMLWYCSTFGASSRKNVQYGIRHGPLAESWINALADLRGEYPGLFDGTLFPRTFSEVKWWWERRSKLRDVYPLRDFQFDLMWTEWRGPEEGWEVRSSAGVLWPLDGSKPATPAEAFIQFRLNKPKSFALERFAGWKGCL